MPPKLRWQAVASAADGDPHVAAGKLPQLLLQMTMAAMVTSLDPTISRGQTSGTDSHQLRALQFWLLDCIWRHCPQALYPAALDAYADLHEVGPAKDHVSWLALARAACWPLCCKEVLQLAICARPRLLLSVPSLRTEGQQMRVGLPGGQFALRCWCMRRVALVGTDAAVTCIS